MLDTPLKKNKLLICACLSFDDYSLFVNANHYFPDRKLKYGDHFLYWHINTDTLNHLFFVGSQLPDFSFVSLKTELPEIIWKISWLWSACNVFLRITPLTLISTLTRISALSLGQHIKRPPPSPSSNKRPPLALLPSLDSKDARKTCCYWHLICNFLNFT